MRLGSLVAPVLAVSCLALVACGGGSGNSSGTGGATGSGGGSGALPACMPTSADCYASGPQGPGAECLARVDNGGSTVWQGRLSDLHISAPKLLASQFIQTNVVDKGIYFNQEACNATGLGTFNWLFEYDSVKHTLTTGGGLPIKGDPKGGDCYVTIPNSNPALKVGPVTVNVTANGNQFSAQGIDVVVPVYQDATATTVILLPLHQASIQGTWSDDHDCIGSYDAASLSTSSNCEATWPARAWKSGGTLSAYMLTTEADQVKVPQVNNVTLCVLLAGLGSKWQGPNNDCQSSAAWQQGGRPPGDWCSATNAPATATCSDAYHLQADFAASAFKVTGQCP